MTSAPTPLLRKRTGHPDSWFGKNFQRQYGVHRAGPEAFQVESDVREAQRLENTGKLSRHVWTERARQFLAGDLDAHDVAVVAHPELPETPSAQSFFALLDHLQRFGSDRATVLDARRQAGRGGLVPDAQAGLAGQIAYVLLAQAGGQQRR